MTEEELKLEKLRQEVKQLSKPDWLKPAYLTILVSALTIVITTAVGFYQYFAKVNQDNVDKIEALEKALTKNEIQQYKTEKATLAFELAQLKMGRDSAKIEKEIINQELMEIKHEKELAEAKKKTLSRQLATVRRSFSNYNSLVESTIEKYENYSSGYARGIISSPSGQRKILEIVEMKNPKQQQEAIEEFAYKVMRQTYQKSSTKIKEEIKN
ncbi:hypothetical protein [Aureispira anguillae]|uniref:Uncharacterized protein n=1 Tax=Aureispira anguillae TaxID=2864201 RepID=A0A916DSP2_9BACT|nr:hypothetical protein [Aureispira anguillae]BDS11275.1 hypothetical protein AsAng_0019870 [Aureispira anguillae]